MRKKQNMQLELRTRTNDQTRQEFRQESFCKF